VNNGGQVIASSFYPEMLDQQAKPGMDIPIYLVILSLIISAGIMYYLKSLKVQKD
jgi:hypothetical protein